MKTRLSPGVALYRRVRAFLRLRDRLMTFCSRQCAARTPDHCWRNGKKPEGLKPCPEWIFSLASALEFRLRPSRPNVPDEPSAAREKGLSMKTGQTIENEATAQPLRSGGLVRPYRGRRCPECYWALYDGDWCQNSACRSHRQSPGRDALRLSNEEAAILIAIDPHRQNTPVCHGEKQSHE